MKRQEVSPGLGIPLYLDMSEAEKDARTLITISDGDVEKTVLFTKRGSTVVDPHEYVVAPPERKSLEPAAVRKQYLRTLLIGASWFVVTLLFSFVVVTATGIISAKVVLTESMKPVINPGDIVLVAPLRDKIPQVGDIVTYTGKRVDGTPVAQFTHRIVGGNTDEGFIMKGDNNKDADVQQPKLDDIEGIVIFIIPLIGKLLSTKNLINLAIAGFGIWLIWDALREKD